VKNENPVPPPALCTSAISFMVSKMLASESSIGSTKQAES
jgi:hypothetical protein